MSSDREDIADDHPLFLAAASMLSFISHELEWCDFREDMLMDTASGKNAQKLRDYLDGLRQEHPELIHRLYKAIDQ